MKGGDRWYASILPALAASVILRVSERRGREESTLTADPHRGDEQSREYLLTLYHLGPGEVSIGYYRKRMLTLYGFDEL